MISGHTPESRPRDYILKKTPLGTLGIEGNMLSQDQITAVLEGKHIIAPKREIQEVRNAIKAYDQLEQWNPVKKNDLFSAHAVLMEGLLDEPGICRSIGVGVMNGKKVIYMAPPASRISLLMDDLLNWLEKTDAYPLISSSVFHCEFEFIHPFEDGNGRLGRLWQTLVLSRWNQMFANLPVESIVFEVTIHHTCRPFFRSIISRSNVNGGAGPGTGRAQIINKSKADPRFTRDQCKDAFSGARERRRHRVESSVQSDSG